MQSRTSAAIDFLRAASVLYIVGFWHLLNYTRAFRGYMNPLTLRLTEIVLGLFVFLSGYLLASKQLPITVESIATFFRRRLVRIWPLYALAICLFIAYGLTTVKTGLLASIGIAMVYDGPPVTLWFISMLLLFYFAAPALIVAGRNVFAFAALTAILLGAALRFQVDYRLALYFPAFALGVFAGRNSEFMRSIPLYAFALASGAAIVFCVLATSHAQRLAGSTLIAALVPLFLLLMLEKMPVETFLREPIRVLSYAGFAMYLFHRPIYITLVHHRPRSIDWQIPFLLFVCLPIVVAISYGVQVSYDYLLERSRARLRVPARNELPDTANVP